MVPISLGDADIAVLEAALDRTLQVGECRVVGTADRPLRLAKDRLQGHQPRRFDRQIEEQDVHSSRLASAASVSGDLLPYAAGDVPGAVVPEDHQKADGLALIARQDLLQMGPRLLLV